MAKTTEENKAAEVFPDLPDAGGRPAFEPTDDQRELVYDMCAAGITQEQICSVLDIDPKTLRKHFRHELDNAVPRANAAVAKSLYQQAMGGNVNAAKFWLMARAGWREKSEVTNTMNISFEEALANIDGNDVADE